MVMRIFSALLFAICMATAAFAGDLPEYKAKVASSVRDLKLSIDCVLPKPVPEATLAELAADVYARHNGKKYQNVFIMWYLPNYKIGGGAWATTNYQQGKLTITLPKMQGE